MKKIIIKRLFESFTELDKAIESAKKNIRSRGNDSLEMLERIEQYEEILEKQRSLATVLCGHASLGNWEEVARHVRLINGLSLLIRDDARAIVATAKPKTKYYTHELTLC